MQYAIKKRKENETHSSTVVLNGEKVLIKLRHFSAKHTTFLCELGLLQMIFFTI